MPKRELFESATSHDGHFAGVFEDAGSVAYFYLCQLADGADGRILDHIHMYTGNVGLRESDVNIRWDGKGEKVGLFIRGELWALFDCATREKSGGDFVAGAIPDVSIPASFSN